MAGLVETPWLRKNIQNCKNLSNRVNISTSSGLQAGEPKIDNDMDHGVDCDIFPRHEWRASRNSMIAKEHFKNTKNLSNRKNISTSSGVQAGEQKIDTDMDHGVDCDILTPP